MAACLTTGDPQPELSERLRIVHVIAGLSTGGAEMMLLKVVRATRHDFDHHVISLSEKSITGPLLEAEGIPVYVLGMPLGRASLRGTWRLTKLLKTLRPDLVQGWMYHANLAVVVMKYLLRARWPTAWTIRCCLDEAREKPLGKKVIQLCTMVSGAVSLAIYNSMTSETQHIARGFRARRNLVIPNGFDLVRFHPDIDVQAVRKDWGTAEGVPVVGFLARLAAVKDPLAFLQAACAVHERFPETVFVMAGPGVPQLLESFPRAAASVARLGSRLVLLPSQSDVSRVLGGLDVFVLSSAWGEAFPNVLGEAMACGVPCVTTDVGDAAYVVGDTGRIVPPQSPDRLAQAVCDLLALPPAERRALGLRARGRVISRFDLDSVAAQYAGAWQALLK